MMQKSESISNLVKALIAAQHEFDPIIKDKRNPFFKSKYADLTGVIEATQSALQKNGLVVSQFPVSEGNQIGVLTVLAHASGEFLSESYTLPLSKQDPQGGAAAVTYARRVAYQGVIGVTSEDDDGNIASGKDEETQEPAAPRQSYQPPPFAPPPTPRRIIAETEAALEDMAKPSDTAIMMKAIVSEEQLNKYRDRCVELQKKLGAAGLKSSRTMRIGSKFLMYLLFATGTKSHTEISAAGWDAFLSAAEAMPIEELVKQVNKVVKEHSKEKIEDVSE
jgi:hypothetical protein